MKESKNVENVKKEAMLSPEKKIKKTRKRTIGYQCAMCDKMVTMKEKKYFKLQREKPPCVECGANVCKDCDLMTLCECCENGVCPDCTSAQDFVDEENKGWEDAREYCEKNHNHFLL